MSKIWGKRATGPRTKGSAGLPLKVYGVMAITTLLTFATLTSGYQLLFSHSVFA